MANKRKAHPAAEFRRVVADLGLPDDTAHRRLFLAGRVYGRWQMRREARLTRGDRRPHRSRWSADCIWLRRVPPGKVWQRTSRRFRAFEYLQDHDGIGYQQALAAIGARLGLTRGQARGLVSKLLGVGVVRIRPGPPGRLRQHLVGKPDAGQGAVAH